MARKKTVPVVEADIFLNCGRRCAMCYGLRGDDEVKHLGQVAHIDRNNTNSTYHNLAYLCQPCHTLYDAKYEAVASYKPLELVQYNRLVRSTFGPNYNELYDCLKFYSEPIEDIISSGRQFATQIGTWGIPNNREMASDLDAYIYKTASKPIQENLRALTDAIKNLMNIYDSNYSTPDEIGIIYYQGDDETLRKKLDTTILSIETMRKSFQEVMERTQDYL